MTKLQHLSECLYLGLCQKLGTRKVVCLRREVADIHEVIANNAKECTNNKVMYSGSSREGFRLQGSDVDYMYWRNDHKVIHDLFQSEKYSHLPNTTLILMQSEESPPGFALLKLLTTTNFGPVRTSCVIMNDELYISSTLYRDQMCSSIIPNSSVHGPCGSGNLDGLEYDTAQSFKCDFWPRSAFSMIQRCQTWPPTPILQDIFNSGCHFVAKGSPVSHYEDKEWRMSFSMAEQKLIYTMNHCQFLVYGFLKLFLKEVINQGVNEKLLCSYFMKTVVFWEIIENKLPAWCPQNIVTCFWNCFKHIIHWVYKGECPNFFIAQNNMFSGKVIGPSQQDLLQHLLGFYEKGYHACLLLSPSVRLYIKNADKVLFNPPITVNIIEENSMSVADFDTELYCEVYNRDSISSDNLHVCMKYLHAVEHCITQTPLTQNHLILLQKLSCTIFQSIAFHLHNRCRDRVSNKMMYIADRISCRLLKLAAKFGFISDMVYIAVYYYRTHRYTEALSVIEMTKVKLSQPYVMDACGSRGSKERYTEAVRGQSWSTKMRQAVAGDIKFDNNICYIKELRSEQQISHTNTWLALQIPPLIMLHMLSVLCYNHVDTVRRQQALDDLYVLLHHDNGMYVPVILRDISYQILGLCQEVGGDKLIALHSYQESLRQYPLHKIKKATEIRILNVLEQLNR